MKNRADEIRKKYGNLSNKGNSKEKTVSVTRDDSEKNHPLFNRHALLMQVMFSIILFLIVGIIFKNNGEQTAKAQNFIKHVYEDEFHFAAAKDWYENQFGKPLALLPKDNLIKKEPEEASEVYAIPADGKVYETFSSNGKGIWIETGSKEESVETAKDGYVVFAGKKEDLGYTVIIQHADEQESWYGDLREIDKSIKLYNYVESGTKLGKVSENDGGKTGKFYFAIKKDKNFIDPSKVIDID